MRKQWVYLECVSLIFHVLHVLVKSERSVLDRTRRGQSILHDGTDMWIFWNSYRPSIIMKTESTCVSTELRVKINHPIHRLRDQFCLACLEFWEIESILSTVLTCREKKTNKNFQNEWWTGRMMEHSTLAISINYYYVLLLWLCVCACVCGVWFVNACVYDFFFLACVCPCVWGVYMYVRVWVYICVCMCVCVCVCTCVCMPALCMCRVRYYCIFYLLIINICGKYYCRSFEYVMVPL